MDKFFKFAISVGTKVASRLLDEISEEFLRTRPGLTEQHKCIVNDLLREALANGLVSDHEVRGYSKPAGEGSTAELVAMTSADIRFAIKIDDNKQLVREALLLSAISGRSELPNGFSERFPKVYAIKNDKPPYAYIMQAFNRRSFSEYIYKRKADCDEISRIGSAVLDALIPAYRATVNQCLKPSIRGIYLNRINQRLGAAKSANKEFKEITKKPIMINGKQYGTPDSYIRIIERNICVLEAPFTTFVHGDLHPGNVLVEIGQDSREIDIKFIDIRDWYEGDYLFDVGKFCHFLEVKGPVEIASSPVIPKVNLGGPSIDYEFELDDAEKAVINSVWSATKKFADDHYDGYWKERYFLSMAANLLSLPAKRFETGIQEKINSAYIFYAAGLIYLSMCCERLNNG